MRCEDRLGFLEQANSRISIDSHRSVRWSNSRSGGNRWVSTAFHFERAVIKAYRTGVFRVLTFPQIASTIHRVLAFSAADQILPSFETFSNSNPPPSERNGGEGESSMNSRSNLGKSKNPKTTPAVSFYNRTLETKHRGNPTVATA